MFTGSVVRKLRVNLKYPNMAVDEFGNRGQWTMIYNEGFEVTINQRTFFAYSYFIKVTKSLLLSILSGGVSTLCSQAESSYQGLKLGTLRILCTFGLLFNSEDGGNTSLRNVDYVTGGIPGYLAVPRFFIA
jgi:hypothetical protein